MLLEDLTKEEYLEMRQEELREEVCEEVLELLDQGLSTDEIRERFQPSNMRKLTN